MFAVDRRKAASHSLSLRRIVRGEMPRHVAASRVQRDSGRKACALSCRGDAGHGNRPTTVTRTSAHVGTPQLKKRVILRCCKQQGNRISRRNQWPRALGQALGKGDTLSTIHHDAMLTVGPAHPCLREPNDVYTRSTPPARPCPDEPIRRRRRATPEGRLGDEERQRLPGREAREGGDAGRCLQCWRGSCDPSWGNEK